MREDYKEGYFYYSDTLDVICFCIGDGRIIPLYKGSNLRSLVEGSRYTEAGIVLEENITKWLDPHSGTGLYASKSQHTIEIGSVQDLMQLVKEEYND